MRRIPQPLPFGLLVGVLLGSVAAGQGCGTDSETTSAFDRGDAGEPTIGEEPPASTGIEPVDGGPKAAVYQGSPLCRVTPTTCDPDDDGTDDPRRVNVTCALPRGDGSDAASSDDAKGCRISASASAAPECGDAKKDGGDGAACKTGADCAPGFDCAAGESEVEGVCRRYCCTGTCGDNRSKNGSPTFCDVLQLWDRPNRAPVCLPIKACELFLEGECAVDETCAVVAEDGATGCVVTGYVPAGGSCDAAHCQAGLTCLGQPGTRRCFQLCRTDGDPACPSTEVCTTSTIFADPTVGVCDTR